jgi:carbamoyltransferase
MYLGVSAYFHDSTVALLDESGQLIDFKKEEWLSRVKGDKSFPRLAINEIINTHKLTNENLKYICFYEKPLKAWLTIIKHSLKNNSINNEVTRNYFKNIWNSSIIFQYDLLKYTKFNLNKTIYCDHHLSHTLSAYYYTNAFPVNSIVIDGYGDSSCSTIHHIKSNNEVIKIWESDYPNSLGLFYSAITDFLGFAINEGEYKVMGLAAYGKPEYFEKLSETIYFKDNKLIIDDSYYDFVRSIKNSFSLKLIDLFKISPRESNINLDIYSKNFQTYANIAASAQKVIEYNLSKIFKHAYDITNLKNYLFTGGVAMNSVAINKLIKNDFIEKIFIPPSPGDSGAAIGAAYYSYINQKNKKITLKNTNIKKPDIYFPGILKNSEEDEIFITLGFKKLANTSEMIDVCADLVLQDQIIATCFGNIETGPRALGHRSLICNGHKESVVNKLNNVIKQRSKFRPIAPVILEKNAKAYFDISDKVYESYFYMGSVTNVKKDKSDEIKPVTHFDNTARVQITNIESLLGKILQKLESKKIYVIANTSFNISSDPIVYSKEDAYLSCERMGIKYLLTENCLYYRDKL